MTVTRPGQPPGPLPGPVSPAGAPGDPAAPQPAAPPGDPGRRGEPDPGVALAARLVRLRHATERRARAVSAVLFRWWQRSLQLRVAVTTLIASGLVVLLIGIFIVDKITNGVLDAERDGAIRQANIGLPVARSALENVDAGTYVDVQAARGEIINTLTAYGRSAGLFDITIEGPGPAAGQPEQIPDALRDSVRAGNLAVQYISVRTKGGQMVPELVVGEPVSARSGLFELYYLFPLSAEQQTIGLLQRTVLIGGIGLVLLVVAITVLVTRQVVRPVRVAAQTAGRLAAGDLSQRISVRGSDDIARLGRSFNDMAGSLQRQIRRLEDLSRLQRRFTSDVSHELRTPLTTIRMATELLHAGRADFPPELARSAELLQAELDRFESLLGDLLEISRYDAGVASLEAETADIRGVVATSVDASRVLAERHGSELVVHAPTVPVPVDMDSRRVERILRNLLGNALDHGEGRPVVVSVGYDDDAVAITVRDHGVGLRPGEAALVFNRFWRGDASRSRLTGGTGLGLAISLEDARLHDGWLQAWGERGKGAQFRLTLPRHAGHTLLTSPLALSPEDE